MKVKYYVLTAFILFVDQISKLLINRFLTMSGSVKIIPGFFNLSLAYNNGMAFGFFPHMGLLLMAAAILAVVVILFILRKKKISGTLSTGTALLLGGAVGNLIDRVRLGHVVDFLDFRFWPTFNFADAAITVGVFLIAIKLFLTSEENQKTAEQ